MNFLGVLPLIESENKVPRCFLGASWAPGSFSRCDYSLASSVPSPFERFTDKQQRHSWSYRDVSQSFPPHKGGSSPPAPDIGVKISSRSLSIYKWCFFQWWARSSEHQRCEGGRFYLRHQLKTIKWRLSGAWWSGGTWSCVGRKLLAPPNN